MLRSRSSSIIFATMYLHCKNWRDADVAHCCIFFENLCDLFKKIGNFCITMSFLLAVALSLKIHIRHCIWMYPILQRPNMTNSDYLTLCNYPYFHQKHPLETKQTNLPDVTVRRIVNPGDDDAWWSSAVAVVVTAFLLKFSGITRLSGGRWGCCWLFFLLGGLAAVFRPISVHEVWVDMLLLLLFCSTDDDVEVVGLRPAMALLMVDAASIEAWWAGGGQMGSWMDNTALAADIEPIVDRCEVAASLALVSLSSWLLLESSDDDQWAGFEVTDFFAKKQRGISQTQMEWLVLFQITIVCASVFWGKMRVLQ